MTAKPVTRRQLMAALKRQDEDEVSEILSTLYRELGEERFHDILLDLWQHQAEALAHFARRSERKPPTPWDGAFLHIQSLIKRYGPTESGPAAASGPARRKGAQRKTDWVLRTTSYKQTDPLNPDEPTAETKSWYELNVLSRLDQVDMDALKELSELSREDGLGEVTVQQVRVVVKRWKAIVDHLGSLDKRR